MAAALTWADDSEWDPSGYFCPICMGSVVGHGDMIDSLILAPVKRVCPVPARIMPGSCPDNAGQTGGFGGIAGQSKESGKPNANP